MPIAYIRDTLIGAEVPLYGSVPDASQAIAWAADPGSGDGDFERLPDGARVVSDSPYKPALAVVTSPECNDFTVKVTAMRRGAGIEWSVDSYVFIASPGRDWRARVKFAFSNGSTTVYAGFHGDGAGDINFHTGPAIAEGETAFEFKFDALNNLGTLKRAGAVVKSAALPFAGFFPGEGANTTPPVGPIPPGALTARLTGYNSGGSEDGGIIKNYSLETEGGTPPPAPGDFWTAFRGAREVD